TTEGRCWVVASGYVKLLDPRPDGNRFIRLILGRGALFGDRPFGTEPFRGVASPQPEQAVAHGPAEVVALDRAAIEAAASADAEVDDPRFPRPEGDKESLKRREQWRLAALSCGVPAHPDSPMEPNHVAAVEFTRQIIDGRMGYIGTVRDDVPFVTGRPS